MKSENGPVILSEAFNRHLSANQVECVRRNITIRVDALNTDQTVAFCTVEQRSIGLLRRTYSQTELVWRAEQALAPLNGLGILPMINVHMPADPKLGVAPVNAKPLLMDWLQGLFGWLGYPMGREVFGAPILAGDPFGFHKAMRVAIVR